MPPFLMSTARARALFALLLAAGCGGVWAIGSAEAVADAGAAATSARPLVVTREAPSGGRAIDSLHASSEAAVSSAIWAEEARGNRYAEGEESDIDDWPSSEGQGGKSWTASGNLVGADRAGVAAENDIEFVEVTFSADVSLTDAGEPILRWRLAASASATQLSPTTSYLLTSLLAEAQRGLLPLLTGAADAQASTASKPRAAKRSDAAPLAEFVPLLTFLIITVLANMILAGVATAARAARDGAPRQELHEAHELACLFALHKRLTV